VDTGIARTSIESAIAVLAGQVPSTFRIEPVSAPVERPRLDRPPPTDRSARPALQVVTEYPGIPRVPVLPAGLPSDLLERRPDVAAAERAVAASSAQIGAAEAAYYPSLSLSASAGLRSSSFTDLLRSPAWFWSPALSALQVLFDAGQRRAITDQARAAHESQVASYRQTVLQGFKEVEDNLAALRILEEEIGLQVETLGAARLALQLVTNQYQAGVVNYLGVLTAQTSALNTERSLLDLRGRRLTASVALIKAVGGGWQGLEAGAGGQAAKISGSAGG
jgi:NodT family efflux transporter outer membrane factor (OMF) lipoprotein